MDIDQQLEDAVPEVEGASEERKLEPKLSYKSALIRCILLMVSVLLIDQIVKVWIKTTYQLHEENSVIGSWFKLHFIENNGIAFGIEMPEPYGKLLLTLFRLIVAGIIFYFIHSLIKKGFRGGLLIFGSLVFAGALGNIIDCIFYGVLFEDINLYQGSWFNGRVVDMLYFPIVDWHWPSWVPVVGGDYFEFFAPIFNIADASISAGIIGLLLFHRRDLKAL